MAPREHIVLNERNTLSEIMRKLKGSVVIEDFGSLNMFHRTFMMTFAFLPEIWQRVIEDARRDTEYWEVYVDLYHPEAKERKPTPRELRILKAWQEHRFRLNLDVEDWFIHSYILMDKFAKFTKKLILLLSETAEERKAAESIPDRSFDRYRKYFLKIVDQRPIADAQYAKTIRENTDWYTKELKNIRDDLIQHENVPRFWAYGHVSRNKVQLSRFRHDPKLLQILYELRDKYESVYEEIKEEKNFFKLLSFFEKHISTLDKNDDQRVEHVIKLYGARFPDIPALFGKMDDFLSLVNDHFVAKIENSLQHEDGSYARA